MNVKELPYIFFALIGIETFLSSESLSNLGKFVFDPSSLGLLILAFSNVRDKLV